LVGERSADEEGEFIAGERLADEEGEFAAGEQSADEERGDFMGEFVAGERSVDEEIEQLPGERSLDFGRSTFTSQRSSKRALAALERARLPASEQHLRSLVEARLFGCEVMDPGGRSARSPPRSRPLGQHAWSRLAVAKQVSEQLPDPEETFRPQINEAPRWRVQRDSGESWEKRLGRRKEPQLERALAEKQRHEEAEAKQCTFQPVISQKSQHLAERLRKKKSERSLKSGEEQGEGEDREAQCRAGDPTESREERRPDDLAGASLTIGTSGRLGSPNVSLMSTSRSWTDADTREPTSTSLRKPGMVMAQTSTSPRRIKMHPGLSGYSKSHTGLGQNMVGLGDPVFEDLHKMLRSLKL